MTEDEARAWLAERYNSAQLARLETYVRLLLGEAERQSLIARSTFDAVWGRHIVDSAQLLALAPSNGLWMDIGSGGGLPGIVVAILRDTPVVMIEPRRRRVEFLRAAIEHVGCLRASVVLGTVQGYNGSPPLVVSARAVASVSDVFAWSSGVVSRETKYLLPRGRNVVGDLEVARHAWQGRFHVEHSITDPLSGIIVAQEVAPR